MHYRTDPSKFPTLQLTLTGPALCLLARRCLDGDDRQAVEERRLRDHPDGARRCAGLASRYSIDRHRKVMLRGP